MTFYVTMRHHLAPRIKDPLRIEERVAELASASRVEPKVVRQLHALNVAPAASNPLRILRELWLDRALLLIAAFYVASHGFSDCKHSSPSLDLVVFDSAFAAPTALYCIFCGGEEPSFFRDP